MKEIDSNQLSDLLNQYPGAFAEAEQRLGTDAFIKAGAQVFSNKINQDIQAEVEKEVEKALPGGTSQEPEIKVEIGAVAMGGLTQTHEQLAATMKNLTVDQQKQVGHLMQMMKKAQLDLAKQNEIQQAEANKESERSMLIEEDKDRKFEREALGTALDKFSQVGKAALGHAGKALDALAKFLLPPDWLGKSKDDMAKNKPGPEASPAQAPAAALTVSPADMCPIAMKTAVSLIETLAGKADAAVGLSGHTPGREKIEQAKTGFISPNPLL
jgi:hypothetical protein